MYIIEKSELFQLPEISKCQMASFPDSFSSRLGKSYVQKSLEWFSQHPKRFLFHCRKDEKIIGFCGGFAPAYYGDGSSSGMLQYAFKNAILGTLKKPWLILDPELKKHYPHIIRNIKNKLLSRKKKPFYRQSENEIFKVVGLVIIAVHPDFRGSGAFELLMEEFEKQAILLDFREVHLSVKKNNVRAIKAYGRNGWSIRKEEGEVLKMHKFL